MLNNFAKIYLPILNIFQTVMRDIINLFHRSWLLVVTHVIISKSAYLHSTAITYAHTPTFFQSICIFLNLNLQYNVVVKNRAGVMSKNLKSANIFILNCFTKGFFLDPTQLPFNICLSDYFKYFLIVIPYPTFKGRLFHEALHPLSWDSTVSRAYCFFFAFASLNHAVITCALKFPAWIGMLWADILQ